MLLRRSELVKQALGNNVAADEAQERIVRLLKKLFKDHNARVQALIRNPRAFEGKDRVRLSQITRILNDLDKVLTDAGLDLVVNGYLDQFEQLTKEVNKYFKKLGVAPQLSGSSKEALTSYIKFSQNQLVDLTSKKLVDPLRETLFQGAFAGATQAEMVSSLAAVAAGLSTAQLETLVGDTMMQYQRALTVETADEVGLEIYVYFGPNDAITSDQCRAILEGGDHGVDGMYYKDEIGEDMHEDLDSNPLIAGGHINCRHKFLPVTLDYAKAQGFEA